MPEWTVIEDEWPSTWSLLPDIRFGEGLQDLPEYRPWLRLRERGCNCDECLRLRQASDLPITTAQTLYERIYGRMDIAEYAPDVTTNTNKKTIEMGIEPNSEAKPEGWTWYQKLSRAISKIRVAYHASIYRPRPYVSLTHPVTILCQIGTDSIG